MFILCCKQLKIMLHFIIFNIIPLYNKRAELSKELLENNYIDLQQQLVIYIIKHNYLNYDIENYVLIEFTFL